MAVGPASGIVVDVTSTTTIPTTTTTSASTTTTSSIPTTTTTTTSSPTTTTTRPSRTTTTAPRTTTTTTVPTTTPASSGTPWGLIALVVVLVVAIGLVVLLLRSRKRRGAESDWNRSARPALSDAQLARASLLSGNAGSDDPEVRSAVQVQVDRAATALERAASGAPDAQAGAAAAAVASGLRGLAFAIEADRLLRHGTSAPSGVQLAEADEARRARTEELNAALSRLSTRVGPGAGRGR